MSREGLLQAAKQALEALEVATTPLAKDRQEVLRAQAALRRELEKPADEPVAFYVYKPTLPRGNLGNVSDGDLPWDYDQDPSSGFSARMLVTPFPPPRKPWVGLTADELNMIGDSMRTWNSHSLTDVYVAIEAKLKEKNT